MSGLTDADVGLGGGLSDADVGLSAGSWTDYIPAAISDIPGEVAHEFSGGLRDIASLANVGETHAKEGQLAGMMQTAQGALGPLRMMGAPITGAARSLIGHGMASGEHALGTLINPQVAARDNPAAMYETAKGDVDRALMAIAPSKAGAAIVPTTEELFDAAEAGYRNMRGYGVEFHPRAVTDLATNIGTELESEGYRDYLAPKTFRAVDELNNPVGANPTISDVEGVRRALGKAAGDPAERDAARRAIDQIDTFMSGLHPSDIAVNPQFARDVASEAAAARGNYAAAKRSEKIDQAGTAAQETAAAAGSGANIDNATRQQIKSILRNPKKLRGFSPDEVDQMRQIVKGTFAGNAMRLLGKLSPSGIVSGSLAAGLGALAHGVPGAVALPALGYVAKRSGDLLTLRRVGRLSEQVRSRSPLGRLAAPPPLRLSAGVPALVAPQLTRQIANPYEANP